MRAFLAMAGVAILIGLAIAYVPGCQPPDMGNCTFNMDTNQYDCPEENE